ncbi:acyl-CoA dehydrogenase family protein [Comamonas sp. 4034]|uniref:acyl-CoA dehydrogenase family protein n=1 Tax=Comamonas sp. 4034 TaxID=3156455 RepID=UPI003D237700
MAQRDTDNLVDELVDYDPLGSDPALQAALERAQAQAWLPGLQQHARTVGSTEFAQWASQANRHTPQLQQWDARGRRIDQVEFHPAWHRVLAHYRSQQLIDMPFSGESSADGQRGRWSAWAASFYLHGQAEAGSLCPATMTTAAIPVLRKEPALWAQIERGITSTRHDERDAPLAEKTALWVGMGMTEKQGGSDVRSNTTVAYPMNESGHGGRGAAYRLQGHKWFYSVPTADAHLVVARMADGPGDAGALYAPLACFWVPRWRPDGTRNTVLVQRLKDKVGNRSNASSEVVFDDAYGVLVGEEGRGIATIMEMATITRLCCVLGSSALLRQATAQALWFTRHRQAFGAALIEQPLMQSVLADLALESEAALLLAMQLAQAFEDSSVPDKPAAQAWQRIMTPAAKFWVCKRAITCSAEAMEVLGGNGYIESSALARLYRETPVNSIWEGSGNVMCLDVLKALQRSPDQRDALWNALQTMAADDVPVQQALQRLQRQWHTFEHDAWAQQAQARQWVQQLVLVTQAGLMRQYADSTRADAFVASRLGADCSMGVIGASPLAKAQIAAILGASLHLQE